MNFEDFRKNKGYQWSGKILGRLPGIRQWKNGFEMGYWRIKKWEEGAFTNAHYEWFFTGYFDLDIGFYSGKKILDIGCGPRGSLEWASGAAERIGLDPLADKYVRLNEGLQKMSYVQGNAEAIPFQEAYFDVVSSFNSLDHVDDPEQSLREIERVLKPGGLFLLIADIHESPTVTEPAAFSWDIVNRFPAGLQVLDEKHYEGHRLYKSIREGIPFDHTNPKKRYGVLSVKALKTTTPG